MEKIGMQKEGTLRQVFHINKEWADLVSYSILRSEWEKKK